VDPTQLGVVTSLAMFLRRIGYRVGVSVMGAVLAAGLAVRLGSSIADPGSLLVAGAAERLDPAILSRFHVALAESMHAVFLVSLFVTFIGIATAFGMTGWQKKVSARANPGEPSPI